MLYSSVFRSSNVIVSRAFDIELIRSYLDSIGVDFFYKFLVFNLDKPSWACYNDLDHGCIYFHNGKVVI